MTKPKEPDLDPTDVTEPDGAPVVDRFASVPPEERFKPTECPKCKRMTLMMNFGLAGGGMGTYWFCDTEDCDYFEKQQDTGDTGE
jgi:hypothetical protein